MFALKHFCSTLLRPHLLTTSTLLQRPVCLNQAKRGQATVTFSMARKRKEDDDDAEPAPKARAPKKAKAPAAEPVSDVPLICDEAWTAEPPSVIYMKKDLDGAEKIAAFDFDGTLVNTKSGAKFAVAADDWVLVNAKIPTILKVRRNELIS